MFDAELFETGPRVYAALAEALPRCENLAGHPRENHAPWASHKAEYHGTTLLLCGRCANGFRKKPGAKVRELTRG